MERVHRKHKWADLEIALWNFKTAQSARRVLVQDNGIIKAASHRIENWNSAKWLPLTGTAAGRGGVGTCLSFEYFYHISSQTRTWIRDLYGSVICISKFCQLIQQMHFPKYLWWASASLVLSLTHFSHWQERGCSTYLFDKVRTAVRVQMKVV